MALLNAKDHGTEVSTLICAVAIANLPHCTEKHSRNSAANIQSYYIMKNTTATNEIYPTISLYL